MILSVFSKFKCLHYKATVATNTPAHFTDDSSVRKKKKKSIFHLKFHGGHGHGHGHGRGHGHGHDQVFPL